MLTLLLCALPLWAPAPQNPAEQFVREFGMAMRVHDTRGQDLSLRRHRKVAVDYYINYMVPTKGPSDLWVDAFIQSWKRVYKSDFPLLYITRISTMSAEDMKVRVTATGKDFGQLNSLHFAAVKSRSPKDWQAFREFGFVLETKLDDIQDHYFQAVVLQMLGDSYFPDFQKGPGDPGKAFEFWGKFLEIRRKIEYDNDQQYSKVHRDWKGLRYELGLEPESTEPKSVSPFTITAKEGEAWHRIELTFSGETKFDATSHPSDKSTAIVTDWFVVGIQGVGTKGVFPSHCHSKDCFMNSKIYPIQLVREKLNLFHIEAGGKPSEPFALKTKPVLVYFEQSLPDGITKRHALWVATGIEKGSINGIELNQALSVDAGLMYFRPASVLSGKSPWGDFQYFEYNFDSVFGLFDPTPAATTGMPPSVYFKRFDSISIGRTRFSRPASRYFSNDKGQWFELQCPKGPAPSFVKLREVSPTLGSLKVVAKGFKDVKLATIILKSLTKEIEGTYLEVGAEKQPAKLPIGQYEFVQGFLRGKDGQSALIFPPEDGPFLFTIEKDEVSNLDLGSPFSLHGSFGIEGQEIVLHPNRVYVSGKSGERYFALNGAPLNRLLVQVKGGKKGETEPAATADLHNDWSAAFFAAPFRLPLPKRGDPQIKISVKKHPWFGKLSTGWIE